MSNFDSESNNAEKSYFAGDAFERAAASGTPPENPVVEVMKIDPVKYGEPASSEFADKKIPVEIVTFPIYDKTGMYLLKAVRCDLEMQSQNEDVPDTRPALTLLLMGGGSSTAIDNMHFLVKLRDGIEHYKSESATEFPAKLRVVLLPHIGGSLREIDHDDPARQDSFSENARILNKALDVKELGVTSEIGLIGSSAGGTQVTELAPLLGDRCKFVTLIDAAGMAEHPNLTYDFVVGQFVDVYEKFKEKGLSTKQALSLGMQEMFNATSTLYGNLKNLGDLVRDFTDPVRHSVNRHAAQAWGELKPAGEILSPKVLMHDTTKEAREKITAPVIFAPMLYAKVVNTLLRGLGSKLENMQTTDDMKKFRGKSPESRAEFDQACKEILREMFPNVSEKDLKFLPYPASTHTSYIEQDLWNGLVGKVAEVLEYEK